MFPTIAEQHAAAHRRELQEAAMMPYETYRLFEIERPKSATELRRADERAGRLAAATAGLARRIARTTRRPGPAPHWEIIRQPLATRDAERTTERAGVR